LEELDTSTLGKMRVMHFKLPDGAHFAYDVFGELAVH
jgi:hypothetical protein